jgi:hypothetical protein
MSLIFSDYSYEILFGLRAPLYITIYMAIFPKSNVYYGSDIGL